MEDFYDIKKALKEIMKNTKAETINDKLLEVIKCIENIEETIKDSLTSIDEYADPSEINSNIYSLLETLGLY
ncbi:hypothetical protein [Clostridium butyricum]|uniref:hypothetical protein n=1 Tax=Clostridium butyricum TaxID=1492 RepID=UPI002AB048BE|nr:hypothetical protein [Clostridium butyricum]